MARRGDLGRATSRQLSREPTADDIAALDALHLAAALGFGDELATFVTYAQRLADAARAAGLEVIAPA